MGTPSPRTLAAALAYADRFGWRVFPVVHKVPAILKRRGGHGQKDATADIDGVRALWRRDGPRVDGVGVVRSRGAIR